MSGEGGQLTGDQVESVIRPRYQAPQVADATQTASRGAASQSLSLESVTGAVTVSILGALRFRTNERQWKISFLH